MSDYPEHDKQRQVVDRSQEIGEFLEWLSSQGYQRMRWGTLTDSIPCGNWNCVDGLINGRGSQLCPDCNGRGLKDVERETWIQDRRSTTQLLAAYFEIDLDKIEAEKRQMLQSLQTQNAGS